MTVSPSCKQRLYDQTGASIVIALVFFLICAVVGSVVLTAATVSSQMTATYRETQQNEYTVSSAARLMADRLEGSTITWGYDDASGRATKPNVSASTIDGTEFSKEFWETYADDIWEVRTSTVGESFTVGGVSEQRIVLDLSGADAVDPVYAVITVDQDFNITALLSLDSAMNSSSAYNQVVEIQCIPHYDNTGRLLKIEWEQPVITKLGSSVQIGGAA